MKWSDFEHYLKGEHLNGRKVIATIAEIVIEETHAQAGRTEEKPVCYFRESKKGLILSPTNIRALPRHVRRRCRRLYRQARATGSDPLPRRRSRYLAGAHQPRTTAGDDAVGRPTTAADRDGCTDRDHTGAATPRRNAAGNACRRHLISPRQSPRPPTRGLCRAIVRPS